MKKIIGTASLMIALILGTCLSSQAQIVIAQPIQIDGGFGMFYHLDGNTQQKRISEHEMHTASSETNNELKIKGYPGLNVDNKYYIIEYEVKYSKCTIKGNSQTDLHSGSYYCKLVGCKPDTKSVLKKLN